MAAPPILRAKAPPASSYRSQSAAARYRGPARPRPVYVPPPRIVPQPAPRYVAPPILKAKAPPARTYTPQSHAAAYRAAPHQYVSPAESPGVQRGHWVTNRQGRQVLIHAVGPGKWVEGALPGHPAPPRVLGTAGSDVQSGGGDYGGAAVERFKQSDAYKQAIADVFAHQGTTQKAAVIRGLVRQNAFDTPEFHAVRGAWQHLATPEMSKISTKIPKEIGAFVSSGQKGLDLGSLAGRAISSIGLQGISPTERQIASRSEAKAFGGPPLSQPLGRALSAGWAPAGKEISKGLGAIGAGVGALQHLHVGPGAPTRFVSQAGISAGPAAAVAVKVPINVARAAAEKPAVIPHTLVGLGETAIGTIPGLIEGAQHPLKTAKAMVADYKARYGPLASGNDRAFIERIKASPQGAAPEVIDALTALGATDATAGRLAVKLAKGGERVLGREPGFLTRERPALRVEGGGARPHGGARPQRLAHGAMKITAQRAEDQLRKVMAGEARTPLEVLRRGPNEDLGPFRTAMQTRLEIRPRANERVPLFRARAQRIGISDAAARALMKMRAVRQRELHTGGALVGHGRIAGAEQVLSRLSRAEQRAFTTVVEGHIPLRSGPEVARKWIERRIKQISKDRESKGSMGRRIPAQFAEHVDDLPRLQWMHDNVEKWLTKRLADTVDMEGARRQRIDALQNEVGALRPEVAQSRVLRPQGEALGIEHPNVANARAIEQVKARKKELKAQIRATKKGGKGALSPEEFQAASMALDRVEERLSELKLGPTLKAHGQYSEQVRAAAEKAGMPAEPGFLHHQFLPETRFGSHVAGSGQGAMAGVKRSEFALHRGGAVDRSMQAYIDGLAHSIKRPFQWRLVDEQARRSYLPPPLEEHIREATGGKLKPFNELTLQEQKTALTKAGHHLHNVMFINPGRLKASTLERFREGSIPAEERQSGELGTAHDLHNAFQQSDSAQPGHIDNEEFLKTKGWRPMPRAAYNEITAGLHPSGFGGRAIGKAQGITGKVLLGANPSYQIMRVIGDAIQAMGGTRGRLPFDMAKFPLWWHQLSEAEKQQARAYAGVRGSHQAQRFGATSRNDIGRWWDEFKRNRAVRGAQAANPFRWLFRSGEAASDYMRHVTFYHQVKHQALENMGHETRLATEAFERAKQAFNLKPTDSVAAQTHKIFGSMPALEEAGRHTLEAMGDYTRFTARERKYLNHRGVIFYPFMRFATRALLHTLPLKHPIVTGLVGELSKLHGDEVRKLLGGDAMPYAYSRLFFDKGGKLHSIDSMRVSPVGSITTDIATGGAGGAAQALIPPAIVPLLNLAFKKSLQGRPVHNGFDLLNQYLTMSYPIRAFEQAHFGTHLQKPESIPFIHERPQQLDRLKSGALSKRGQYQQAKQQASGPLLDKMLAGALGVWPKPDTSKVVAAEVARKKAAKTKRGGGGSSGGSGGGTFSHLGQLLGS